MKKISLIIKLNNLLTNKRKIKIMNTQKELFEEIKDISKRIESLGGIIQNDFHDYQTSEKGFNIQLFDNLSEFNKLSEELKNKFNEWNCKVNDLVCSYISIKILSKEIQERLNEKL